ASILNSRCRPTGRRMRLCSYRESGGDEHLAVVVGDRALPAADLMPNGPATMADLFAGGERALAQLRSAADQDRVRRDGSPLQELQLLAPVPRPRKVVAIGRNYREHAAEE